MVLVNVLLTFSLIIYLSFTLLPNQKVKLLLSQQLPIKHRLIILAVIFLSFSLFFASAYFGTRFMFSDRW